MIKQNAQAVLIDQKDYTNVHLDVNFDEKYKDCVKITIWDKQAILKYTDLFSFMFTIGTKEQQAQMIPVRQELGNEYMKQIHVRLKKDMKKGEEMVVNVPIHVPKIIEESIRFEMEKSVPTPY